MNVVFVIRCLYSALSLTLVREQRFIVLLLLLLVLLVLVLLLLLLLFCIGMGGMKVCVIAKLTASESKREFLYNIF